MTTLHSPLAPLSSEPAADRSAKAHRLITASRIGETNRGRVLETLHMGGPSSRAQLARSLNVNRATIASILQPLIDAGILVEGTPISAPITGGKPARPLWFSHDGPLLGGVHVSPDGATAALLGFDGRIVERFSSAYARTADQNAILSAIEEATRKCFKGRSLTGIGVAASGMVNSTTGQIISMILTPGVDGLEVGTMLSNRFGTTVLVDHHPRVLALGDRWFGLGRQVQDFASVYTGEALGFGIVRQGQIVCGPDGAGGESGHTIVQLDGAQCQCGNRGCWETVATLAWLRSEAWQLGLPGASDMTSAKLVDCLANKTSGAGTLLDRYARNLATGMANNEHILASGTYIMHGDVCGGGEPMRQAIEDWVIRLSPKRGNPPKVLFAESPDDMSLLGGGGLVLSQVFSTSA